MRFPIETSPHAPGQNRVSQVMRRVLLALIPGTAIYVWFFGSGVLVNIALAVVTCVAAEALMLTLRGRPVRPFLSDYSAIVTGWLLALALPTLAPWWLTVIGSAFSIVVAKQLYGGLGYNLFNPAMIGYVVLLVSFPKEMTQWLPPQSLTSDGGTLGVLDVLRYVFLGDLPVGISLDAITMATPLDHARTELSEGQSLGEIQTGALFGWVAGVGWEWVAAGYLVGGLWMLRARVIHWQIPVAVLGGLAGSALLFYLVDPGRFASPLYHLFSGAAMLGAFFIATDPVSASTTPRGRLVYGAGIGILTYVIRTFGGYPDGIAFAVVLMNICVPLIDHYTQPRVFGERP